MDKLLVIAAILTIFSTPALAQSSSSGSGFLSFLPLIIILAIYYFFSRHQKKKARMHEQTLDQRFVDIENRLEKIESSRTKPEEDEDVIATWKKGIRTDK